MKALHKENNSNIFPIFDISLKQIRNFLEKNYTAVLLVVTSARPMIISMRYYCADFE